MPERPETPEDLPVAEAAEAPAEPQPSAPEDEAPEIAVAGEAAESTEIRPKEEEETPVIDVHAPHGGMHTWKDFWIHLGTITLGLLIAISLEQSVEWVHHLHQRHVLEEQFTAEGEENKELAEIDFRALDDRMEWLLGLQQDIEIMRTTGGKANLPYREMRYRPRGHDLEGAGMVNLGTAVWDAAKGTERFALLPDELADRYTRTYRQVESYRDLSIAMRNAATNQTAFEVKFADSGSPLTPVLSRMSPTDLAEYEGLVTARFAAARQVKANLISFYGANLTPLKGLRGNSAAVSEQEAARRQFPDDFKKMAAEIEAERAKVAK